jgi:hypothetical protein
MEPLTATPPSRTTESEWHRPAPSDADLLDSELPMSRDPIDRALELTFPASDPPAWGTGGR